MLADSGVTCVLVEGPGGCGKTARLLELAAGCGRHPGDGLLYLHLGEQIDGKVRGAMEIANVGMVKLIFGGEVFLCSLYAYRRFLRNRLSFLDKKYTYAKAP